MYMNMLPCIGLRQIFFILYSPQNWPYAFRSLLCCAAAARPAGHRHHHRHHHCQRLVPYTTELV
jgi:hypothetical protein